MKKVRINQINVGDVISYMNMFWLVESITHQRDPYGDRYIVKTHDCDDIFYIRYFTDSGRIYKVMD